MDPKIQAEIERVQLETALLNLEQAKIQNAQHVARTEEKKRFNAQRQNQLSIDRHGRIELSKRCSHRQGGTPRNPLKGKGPTSLNVVKMPDGFTKMITCSICRLRKFSPFPPDMSTKKKDGETAEQAKKRVAKFHADKKHFDWLLEKAQDGLTPEATQEMDCGVVIKVTDADGMPVYRPRPCDSYAMQF